MINNSSELLVNCKVKNSNFRIQKNSKIKAKLSVIANGKVLTEFSVNSANFMFNIIITKRNKTAIAPTYITTNDIGKNSKLNINNIQVTILKVKIKKRTLNTGFFELITKIEDIIHKLEKKTNNIELIISFFIFF